MEITAINNPFSVSLASGNTGMKDPINSGFAKVFETLDVMKTNQVEAKNKMADVVLGNSEDTHGAMIALEKVNIEAQLFKTVQEKVTQGYNQVINMQI